MIEIDLLPEEIKKKRQQFKMPKLNLSIIPLLAGFIAILVLAHFGITTFLNINKDSYENMSNEWKRIEPQKRAIELIAKENVNRQKDIDEIEALMQGKILWSKKLNQLSDLIVPGVWYTKISIGKKAIVRPARAPLGPKRPKRPGRKPLARKRSTTSYLGIEGEVSSAYGEPLEIVAKFIENLESDPRFYNDFSNIELFSTKLHSILETEVMAFSINCYFKEKGKDEPS